VIKSNFLSEILREEEGSCDQIVKTPNKPFFHKNATIKELDAKRFHLGPRFGHTPLFVS